MDLKTMLELQFLGNTVKGYLMALTILVSIIVIARFFIYVGLKRLEVLARTTATDIDDFIIGLLERLAIPFIYFSSIYASTKVLVLHPFIKNAANIFELLLFAYFGGMLLVAVLEYAFRVYCERTKLEKENIRTLHGLLRVIKGILWGVILVFLLDNLGFKISAVIAGLGIGGVAVALAAQALLKDFFSYFSIIFDQPFKLGDFIIVGDHMGTVEYIGIKTTRIRSLGGELIVFSNTDLTDSRVRNYKVMEKRRVLFNLGVTYDTKTETLREIPGIIKNIITGIKDTVFDRAHFASYGDFSLNIEVVYYVVGPDYNKYMDIQQEINLAIKEQFGKKGIEFAYPTQKLFVTKEDRILK